MSDTASVWLTLAVFFAGAMAFRYGPILWQLIRKPSDVPIGTDAEKSRRPRERYPEPPDVIYARDEHAELHRLERELKRAILDPGARERLVSHAIVRMGGDRVAAIKIVLEELSKDVGRHG